MRYNDKCIFFLARMKPNQNRLEMEVTVNTSSDNYSKSKGEQIALNVDGSSVDDTSTSFYSSNCMDKQILSSTPAGIDSSR